MRNLREEKITIAKIKFLKSEGLKKVAYYLVDHDIEITFFGQAWTNQQADWIYFDTVLDLADLRKRFDLQNEIVITENTDIKSGTERGLVDQNTGEGIMGRMP